MSLSAPMSKTSVSPTPSPPQKLQASITGSDNNKRVINTHSVPSVGEQFTSKSDGKSLGNSFVSQDSDGSNPSDDLLNVSFGSNISLDSNFFNLTPPSEAKRTNNPKLQQTFPQLNPSQIQIPAVNPLISPLPSPVTTDPSMFGIAAAAPSPTAPALISPMPFVTNPLLNQIPNMNMNNTLVTIPAHYLLTNPNSNSVFQYPINNNTVYSQTQSPGFAISPSATAPVTITQTQNNNNQTQHENQNGNENTGIKIGPMQEEDGSIYHRYVTGKFISQYYNELQSDDPNHVKNFYHVDAEIHRSRMLKNPSNTNPINEEPFKIKTSEILSFLTDNGIYRLILVEVKNVIHQKAICNSILIQVDGIIKLQNHDSTDANDDITIRSFEQTFFVNKEQSEFWLIQNDILSYHYSDNDNEGSSKNQGPINSDDISSLNSQKENDRNRANSSEITPQLPKMHPTWSSITASKKVSYPVHPTPHNFDDTPRKSGNLKIRSPHGHNHNNYRYHHHQRNHSPKGQYVKNYDVPKQTGSVNKRMVNKFYHDTSYQNYDNDLAIFIKGIPKDLTDTKLRDILRMNIIRYSHKYIQNKDPSIYGNLDIEQLKDIIAINYVDINYHKEFAFIYLANYQTLDITLEMGHIYLGPNLCCQIQRKQSHNGPRKFSNPHYNQRNNNNNNNISNNNNGHNQYHRRH